MGIVRPQQRRGSSFPLGCKMVQPQWITTPAFRPSMDHRSDQAKQYRHLYGRRWRNYRERYLREHPLCVMCQREGRITPAKVVDHITDHKGCLDLFWDADNHQPLCKPHHDRDKQAETHKGFSVRVGDDGYPVDPRHPAAR